jgi:hypothetical protein
MCENGKGQKARYVFIVLKYARRDEKKIIYFSIMLPSSLPSSAHPENTIKKRYKHNWYLVIYIKLYIYINQNASFGA